MNIDKVEFIVKTLEHCKNQQGEDGGCAGCELLDNDCFMDVDSIEMAQIITDFYNERKELKESIKQN